MDGKLSYVKFYIIGQTVNPVLGAHTYSKLGLIQRLHIIERRNRAVPHGISQDYQDLFSELGCYQALNQGRWKHPASDTYSKQVSNSLEGHGQGWAGQNGAWWSDCEATWADEMGQFHGDCYLAKWKGQDLHRFLWPKPCHTHGTCSLENC